MDHSEHSVVIAGGGPTGLMLAAELWLAGADVLVVERRPDQHIDESRARGLHSRAVEILDQRGIADRFIAQGQPYPRVNFGGVILDISDFPTRHNYLLGLLQSKFELILAGWVEELGVPIMRSREVIDFSDDDAGVTIELSGGERLRASYLVGCDGGRSLVRKRAGIPFVGLEATVSYIIAEVRMDEEPAFGVRPEGGGIGKAADGVSIGVVVREQSVKLAETPSADELREALRATYGTDYGLRSINWISRFSDATRQAETYRKGRVLLAGDSAHVHPPQGGQGLGLGLQDAVNLGWKLAQVVNGILPDALLDTYDAERRPVGARVLQNTRAQVALTQQGGQQAALREIVGEVFTMDEPRKHLVGMLSGLDIRYDLGEGHPLLGRRIPDLDITLDTRSIRLFSLLHEARALLINFTDSDSFDRIPLPERVHAITATYTGKWLLPVIGEVDPPAAVLIRPDGYVAWTGSLQDPELSEVLSYWFGKGPVA